MSKFTFIREESSYVGNTKQTVEFAAVCLDDVLMQFEDFLKGAGFVFEGQLQFVDESKWEPIPEDINIQLNEYRMSEQEDAN